MAGFRMTSALMPIIMASVTLLGCIRRWGDPCALGIGIGAGLGGWAIMAGVAYYFATVEGANPDVYHELRCRFTILQTPMDKMDRLLNAFPNPAQPPSEDPQLSIRRATDMEEINTSLREVGNELDPERVTTQDMGSRQNWVLGYDYIILQKQIHRVEENLLLIVPRPAVLAEARYDGLRLQDSTIPSYKELLSDLQRAMTVLNAPPQDQSPHQSPTTANLLATANPPAATNSPAVANPRPAEWTPKEEFEAREMLRQVRRTINEFRDERRTGIVRARNRLFRTLTLTGLMIFLVVALAALALPDTLPSNGPFIAGATFFLIGSIVGVFNQLYLDAGTEVATEDYGLALVRLLHTPMISGLAALLSVAIIPILSATVDSSMVNSSAPTAPGLGAIFNLPLKPFSLMLAALFGMSPVVLIGRLQQEANRYKADLKSSEASPHARG